MLFFYFDLFLALLIFNCIMHNHVNHMKMSNSASLLNLIDFSRSEWLRVFMKRAWIQMVSSKKASTREYIFAEIDYWKNSTLWTARNQSIFLTLTIFLFFFLLIVCLSVCACIMFLLLAKLLWYREINWILHEMHNFILMTNDAFNFFYGFQLMPFLFWLIETQLRVFFLLR